MDINQVVYFYKEITNLKEVFAFSESGLQMNKKNFIKNFDSYEINKREGSADYPYELTANIDGVRFYCIITKEEYEEITPVDTLINEYESKLAALKSKKEVTV